MIKFEFVKEEQIPSLAVLASEIWHEYWQKLLSPEQIDYMVENFQSEHSIREQIAKEGYSYYFILQDNTTAGYFGICPKDGYLFLSKLYLKKDFRNHGIGRQAFEEIKTLTSKAGFNKIRLTVNKYNSNTIKAYEKWGLSTIDAVVTDIGSGFVMDDYIMEYDCLSAAKI